MVHDLNQQLTDIKIKLLEKKKLEKRLHSTQTLIEQEKGRLFDLLAVLQKEHADVEALESMSLKAFFYSVFVDKTLRLDAEKKEFAAAKLKHDECHLSLQTLQQELSDLTNQLKSYSHIEQDYQSLLRTKENALHAAASPYTESLHQLTAFHSTLQSEIHEYLEVIQAGKAAEIAVRDTMEKLESAKNWGIGDMFIGGLVVTSIKYSKIDEAKTCANHAQHLLKKFARELKDVEFKPQNMDIKIDGLTKFADYVFDGLIVDWIAQSKINSEYEKIKETKTLLNITLSLLQKEFERKKILLKQIEKEKTELLESL